MKPKVLSIAPDEKFIDGAIECFDLYSNKFEMHWCVCKNSNQQLKHIKHIKRVIVIPEKKILKHIYNIQYDAIVLHSFGVINPSIINNIPKEIKLFWFGFGYDIYNYPSQAPFLQWNLYKPITKKYITSSLIQTLRNFFLHFLFIIRHRKHLYEKALNRIDYFSGVLDFEYDLMRRNPYFRAQQVKFSYSSLEILKSYEQFQHYNGNNILVGNSAAITNNHLDLLDYLKKIDLNNKKIILPLSYAGTKRYVRKIQYIYKKNFGDGTIILTDFIPLSEYMKYIRSCSIAVFFMERQQAMGNIISALKNGCKVFLSDNNPVYKFYKKIGIIVFSVENELNNKNIEQPLSFKEIAHNRQILKTMYDYDACINNLDTIYKML